MRVYLASKQDYIDFVNGRPITAYSNAIENHYGAILVAQVEILDIECNMVTIIKKY